jgi:hypothetical protein
MNYINYILDVEGINPFLIKLNYNQGLIKDIFVNVIEIPNQVTGKMSIKFILESNINSNEDAFNVTQEVVKDVVNLLFTNVVGRFGIPSREKYSLNGMGPIAVNSITLQNVVTVDLPENISQVLETGLNNNTLLANLKNDPIHRLYRDAMRTDDTTSRFMFLYGTLLAIEPTQPRVDRLILSEDSSVEMRSSTNPRNPSHMETKYTWLRNQIGHTNAGTNLNEVENEIAGVCKEFAEIVKSIIN